MFIVTWTVHKLSRRQCICHGDITRTVHRRQCMTELSPGGRYSRVGSTDVLNQHQRNDCRVGSTEVLNQHQKGETVKLGIVLIPTPTLWDCPHLIPLNPLIVVFQFLFFVSRSIQECSQRLKRSAKYAYKTSAVIV
jgi:hypothetical protein